MMATKVRSAIAIVLSMCFFLIQAPFAIAAGAPQGRLLVFDENPFNGSPRGFYEYDFATQQLSLVKEIIELPGIRFEGMEWNPQDGLIYAGSNIRNLYSIDLGDGSVDLVGTVPSISFVRGIAFDPSGHQMYGFGFGPRLYEIDAQNASAVQVGLSPNLDVGLAFSPDGKLWGMNGSRQLIQISDVNGQTISTAAVAGGRPLSDLAGSSDNRVFGVSWQHGGITEIGLLTGTQTVIKDFANHQNGLMAIVFIPTVPEPTSGLLILIAGGTPMLCRNRCNLPA